MPEDRSQTYHVGPAGWSYADWEHTVYPPGVTRAGRRLEFIVERFNLIEINASFYRVPSLDIVERWARVAGGRPGFRFTVKAPGAFTHEGEREGATARGFRAVLDTLQRAGLLGAVLFQFPYSFRCERAEKIRLKVVLDLFEAYPSAVEVRHRSWATPAYLDYLCRRGVAFCNIDQPAAEPDGLGLTAHVTSALAYLRLHGRHVAAWRDPAAGRDARFDWLYGPGEIAAFAGIARRLAAEAEKVYIVTNNHYQGKAVVNAGQIAADLWRD